MLLIRKTIFKILRNCFLVGLLAAGNLAVAQVKGDPQTKPNTVPPGTNKPVTTPGQNNPVTPGINNPPAFKCKYCKGASSTAGYNS